MSHSKIRNQSSRQYNDPRTSERLRAAFVARPRRERRQGGEGGVDMTLQGDVPQAAPQPAPFALRPTPALVQAGLTLATMTSGLVMPRSIAHENIGSKALVPTAPAAARLAGAAPIVATAATRGPAWAPRAAAPAAVSSNQAPVTAPLQPQAPASTVAGATALPDVSPIILDGCFGAWYRLGMDVATPSGHQRFDVGIDPGSSDLLLADSTCVGCGAVDPGFDADNSHATFNFLGYGGGMAYGFNQVANVTIGHLPTQEQSLLQVTVSDFSFDAWPCDDLSLPKNETNQQQGLLGLGTANLAHLSGPLLDNIAAQAGLYEGFSTQFCDRGGNLFAGGYDRHHGTGPIMYTPMNASTFYAFGIEDASMGGSGDCFKPLSPFFSREFIDALLPNITFTLPPAEPGDAPFELSMRPTYSYLIPAHFEGEHVYCDRLGASTTNQLTLSSTAQVEFNLLYDVRNSRLGFQRNNFETCPALADINAAFS